MLDAQSRPPSPPNRPLTLVGPGDSPPPPVPVELTPEMVAAVTQPEMIRELDQIIFEARGRAERPDLHSRRREMKSLAVLVAIRGVLEHLAPSETAQEYASVTTGQGA